VRFLAITGCVADRMSLIRASVGESGRRPEILYSSLLTHRVSTLPDTQNHGMSLPHHPNVHADPID